MPPATDPDHPARVLHERVAFVTGAARGIGAAIAHSYARAGAHVVLADVDVDGVGRLADELRASGARAEALACDVTSTEQVERAVEHTLTRRGRLDVVVNNAGISARIPAEHYPDDALLRMLDINVMGVYRLMRAAARRWIATGSGGNIVNLASYAGLVADPMSAPYAASKGAVVQLTRTCAVEWAEHRIRVNAIAPGYVRTEMTRATVDTEEGMARIRLRTPMGRPAEPAEIAEAALFLASDASRYVTGHVLAVDGGWTAQ